METNSDLHCSELIRLSVYFVRFHRLFPYSTQG